MAEGRRHRGTTAVRVATWSAPPWTVQAAESLVANIEQRNWTDTVSIDGDGVGPVTIVCQVVGRDRWNVDQRIRAIGTLLSRAGVRVNLVSVERLPPHENRQPSVDARQARRAELRAARAARAQNPGHAQVHGQAEQKHEQGSDPVAVD